VKDGGETVFPRASRSEPRVQSNAVDINEAGEAIATVEVSAIGR